MNPRRLAALGAVAITSVAMGTGASAAPEALEVVGVDTATVSAVSVVVAAPAQLAGTFVPADAWVLREDSERRSIAVEPVSNDDLEIALAIDTSGSMLGAPLEAAKAAAVTFIRQMPERSRVALLSFDDQAVVLSPLTSDRELLVGMVQGLQAQGETALDDAVVAAASLFPAGTQARRSLVLLSDGGDTRSTASADVAIAALGAAGATGYVVSLVTPETDATALQTLAERSGGRVVPALDPEAISEVLADVGTSLTNQYRLTFPSEGRGRTVIAISLRDAGIAASAERVIELPTRPAPNAPETARPTLVTAAHESWKVTAGLAAAGVGILVLALSFIFFIFAPRQRERRKDRPNLRLRAPRTGALQGISDRAASLAERSLERRGRGAKLNAALEHAGLALRPGEYVVLAVSAAFVGFALSLLVIGVAGALVVAVLVAIGFRLALRWKADRRRSRFADQLVDTLQLLAGSLRAGYGMLQAVDAVAREADSPTAEEFQRLVIETRLGRSVSDALHAMAARVDNDDFEWVEQAVDINREVGGDLTEVLDRVGETIRERDQIRRQVKALSAEGRLSALILIGLPIGMFGFIRVVNPEYIGELTGSSAGIVMIVVGVVLLLLGSIWLRNIVRVRF